MRIEIKNFCALKNVEFTLNPGINVIAGKNGSGKSQLLMALAHQYGNQTLRKNGFENIQVKTVVIEPRPRKVLWRQPIRNVGSGTRGNKYATLSPPSYASREDHIGYTWGVDERYNNLHNSLTNMYVAGNLLDSSPDNRENWIKLTTSFLRIFGKEFAGEYTSRAGRVGIRFENEICRFDTLSTGELEFLSLFSDILTEPEVDLFIIDEIDAHFHPNLQRALIAELESIASGKNILLTTHSPALMLSVPPSNLFYLRHASELGQNENQIIRLVEDIKLLSSISEMYAGFIGDIRVGRHFFESVNHELLVYADQCLSDSVVIGHEKSKDSDSQTSILRGLLLTEHDEVVVQEVGVGKGRLLAAFNSLTDRQLAKISYIGIDIDEDNLEELDAYAETIGLKQKLKSFRCTSTIDATNKADLCILANVLHEVGPDMMCNFLSQVIASLKNGSKILILEALELAVGEKRFVVFDAQSINEILKRNIDTKNVSANFASIVSFGGTPLLEGVITVSKVEALIPLSHEDIIAGLRSIIESVSEKLSLAVDGREALRARSLAFHCHNIANACGFMKKLQHNRQAEQ